MDSSAINLPSPGRRRGRYSDSFKADIVAACKAPGVSTAAVALANSLNANLVRRWVADSDPAHKAAVQLARVQSAATVSVSPTVAAPASTPGFVPVPLATPSGGADDFLAWQQERLAAQAQIEKLQADLLAREGLLNEQRALLSQVPVSTAIGCGNRPAASHQVPAKAPPKSKARRSAACPSAARLMCRVG